jgi:hypothetical protein
MDQASTAAAATNSLRILAFIAGYLRAVIRVTIQTLNAACGFTARLNTGE